MPNSISRFLPFLLVLSLVAIPSGASGQEKAKPKQKFSPDKVVDFKTVAKPDGSSDKLKLHVFKPANHKATDKAACIVFFFGGGWNGGTPEQFFPHCEYLASRGMVAISAQYRTKSSHKVIPKTCVFDGKSAIRWVRSHAQELGVNPDRVAAGGGSAGGHVASAVAACQSLEEETADQTISCIPIALVLFNPVYDNGPEGYANARVKKYWKEFSPKHNIHKDMPPTIAFFGSKDKLIPVATTKAFGAEMKKVGVRYDNHIYEGQGHGFFNFGRSQGDQDCFVDTVLKTDKFLASLGLLSGEPTIKIFGKKPLSPKATEQKDKDLGTVIFQDDFERTESQETTDEPGNGWNTNSKNRAAGNKQVDLKDGKMHIYIHEAADHAVSVTHPAEFQNGSVQMKFMLENEKDTLGLNFADLDYKKVWAGHLFKVTIGTKRVEVADLKTGVMDLEIRTARKNKKVTPEIQATLKTKVKKVPNKLETGKWYTVTATVKGDNIAVSIDGKEISTFSSQGIAHPTKRMLRLSIPKNVVVDDLKIFRKD